MTGRTTHLQLFLFAASILLSASHFSNEARADFILKYTGLPMDQSRCHQNSTKTCVAGNMYAFLRYTGTLPSNYRGDLNGKDGISFKRGIIGVTDAYKVAIVTAHVHVVNGYPDSWLVNTSAHGPLCEDVYRHFETTDTDDLIDADQRKCPPDFRFYGNVRSPGQWTVLPDVPE